MRICSLFLTSHLLSIDRLGEGIKYPNSMTVASVWRDPIDKPFTRFIFHYAALGQFFPSLLFSFPQANYEVQNFYKLGVSLLSPLTGKKTSG